MKSNKLDHYCAISDYEKLDGTQLFSTALQSLCSFACFLYMLQMKNNSPFFWRPSVVKLKMSLCVFQASWLYLPKCSVCNILMTEKFCFSNVWHWQLILTALMEKTRGDSSGSKRRLPLNYRYVGWKGSLQVTYSYLLLRACNH